MGGSVQGLGIYVDRSAGGAQEERLKTKVAFSESIETFHRMAGVARRFDDFGPDDYHEALEVLCRSLDEDAALTPTGATSRFGK